MSGSNVKSSFAVIRQPLPRPTGHLLGYLMQQGVDVPDDVSAAAAQEEQRSLMDVSQTP